MLLTPRIVDRKRCGILIDWLDRLGLCDGRSAWFCLSCVWKSDGWSRSWPMLLYIDAEGRGRVCTGICGNIQAWEDEFQHRFYGRGLCWWWKVGHSAMVFQSPREVAGELREFLRWIEIIEFTPALLNIDARGKRYQVQVILHLRGLLSRNRWWVFVKVVHGEFDCRRCLLLMSMKGNRQPELLERIGCLRKGRRVMDWYGRVFPDWYLGKSCFWRSHWKSNDRASRENG